MHSFRTIIFDYRLHNLEGTHKTKLILIRYNKRQHYKFVRWANLWNWPCGSWNGEEKKYTSIFVYGKGLESIIIICFRMWSNIQPGGL